MCCLDVEGLLDFGVRCDDEVEEDDCGYEEREENVWSALAIYAQGQDPQDVRFTDSLHLEI